MSNIGNAPQTMKISTSVYLIVPALMTVALGSLVSAADSLYFPNRDQTWQTVDPSSVGWDEGKLAAALDLAGERNSSGVLNGRKRTSRRNDRLRFGTF